MADQDQGPALADIALPLIVNLRDQRAGGVDDRQVPRGGLVLDGPGDAMGAEHGHGSGRNVGQFLDEDGALGLQRFDHVFVVHVLMAHIDRRPVFLERAFHDVDGAHDTRAEPAGLRQINRYGSPITQAAPNPLLQSASKVPGGHPQAL